MPLDASIVDERRTEYRKTFGEVDSREPVLIEQVTPGTVLQHWGLPNQSSFMFLGVADERILATLDDGHVVGFRQDAWFVIVELPSDNRTSLCAHAMANLEIVFRDNRDLWKA